MTSMLLRNVGRSSREMSVLITLLALATACTGTPVTEPPGVAPPELPQLGAYETLPSLEPAAGDFARPIGLSGRAGAVEPDAFVWVINLDSEEPPLLARADADGSFEIPISAGPGNEMRMHVLVDGEPSLPLDMVMTETIALEAPMHGTCVRTTPIMVKFGDVAVDATDEVDLLIENTCASAIDLAVSLHASTTDFRLGQLGEAVLASGESTTLPVTFAPEGGGTQRSGVAFIAISGESGDDRIAVSLWGTAR